ERNPSPLFWNFSLVQPLWRSVWRLLRKLGLGVPFDPAIPLLGIYPKEFKKSHWKDRCTPLFIAAQFVIAQSWKQPKCPSTGEWIKKMWFFYKMEYYSAIKNDKIDPFRCKWRHLEDILISEINRSQIDNFRIFSLA
ncbi:hypothetical protein, partial [Microcystis aeruginosa]|uniref:hypothetical protein n=1 Tax=Microcystis aeruginosa TaxID=1126 RepID=UPI001C404C62